MARKERDRLTAAIMLTAVLSSPSFTQAQSCPDGQVTGSDGQCRPALVIPELSPSTETETEALYTEALLYAPDGKQVNLTYLQDYEVIRSAQVIPVEELQLPISPQYSPRTQRGYFIGHLAWDVTYRIVPEADGLVRVEPPHPQAILLAVFENVPLGDLAVRIQASGAIEIFYVSVDLGDGVARPYLITYAHLEPTSIPTVLEGAGQNGGQVSQPAILGHTGYTDGTHVHMQVIDLSVLYDHFQTDNPIAAYGAFTDLMNPISDELAAAMFVNPTLLYPQLAGM